MNFERESKYRKLAEELIRELAEEEGEGSSSAFKDRFFTRKELSLRYGVAPLTAYRILKYIESRGLIACQRGRRAVILRNARLDSLRKPSAKQRIGIVCDEEVSVSPDWENPGRRRHPLFPGIRQWICAGLERRFREDGHDCKRIPQNQIWHENFEAFTGFVLLHSMEDGTLRDFVRLLQEIGTQRLPCLLEGLLVVGREDERKPLGRKRSVRAFRAFGGALHKDMHIGAANAEGTHPAKDAAFLFPGQGNLHPTMARSFLENEKDFRLRFQKLAALCRQAQGPDLEALLRGCWAGEKKALCALCETQTAQPLLFALELALATTLVERGVRPDCLMGHSLGEYTAACLAGVFSPEDGMRLVTLRGALMQKAPRGRMLVVSLHHSRVREVLGSAFAGVEISLVNSAANCVLTGDEEALERCAQAVAEHGQRATFLKTSHAFHSASMEGIMDDFGTLVSSFTLHEPKLPIVSNLTGTWAGAEMAQPDYWVRHLRSTVQFAKGLATLRTRAALGLEAGPGNVLRSLATQVPGDKLRVIPGLDALKTGSGQAERGLADIAAECWQNGAAIDWEAYFAPYEPYRCPMPETAFTPRRYWIAPGAVQAVQVAGGAQGSLLADHHEKTGADSGMEKYARTCRTAYEAPEGEVERLLVGLWEELLFVDHIGVCDDFVELGGNSIQVMQMVRAAAGLGLSFTSKDVFEAGTIRKLALRARSGAAARTASPGPVPVPPYLEGRLARGQDGLARCCVLACPKGFDMADAGRLARALARAHDRNACAWPRACSRNG